MIRRMEGKIALVTGAASGIGKASAMAFAREGARVVVADVNMQSGQQCAASINETGGEAVFFSVNVANARDVEALVAEVIRVYGRLDCAHNNAGISGGMSNTAECTEEAFDEVIAVNLKGVWLCMKHELAQMLAQGGGSIVNTASTAGVVGSRRSSAYAAASHGIVGLTKSASLEYAEAGIRINAVCPGATRTPMIEGIVGGNPEIESNMLRRVPMGRMAAPEEIAEAVVWLCSNAASFVTGHALLIDGGVVAS